MSKNQMNAPSTVNRQLSEFIKQLRIANELKALEMRIVHCGLNNDDDWGSYRSFGQRIDDIMEN